MNRYFEFYWPGSLLSHSPLRLCLPLLLSELQETQTEWFSVLW